MFTYLELFLTFCFSCSSPFCVCVSVRQVMCYDRLWVCIVAWLFWGDLCDRLSRKYCAVPFFTKANLDIQMKSARISSVPACREAFIQTYSNVWNGRQNPNPRDGYGLLRGSCEWISTLNQRRQRRNWLRQDILSFTTSDGWEAEVFNSKSFFRTHFTTLNHVFFGKLDHLWER